MLGGAVISKSLFRLGPAFGTSLSDSVTDQDAGDDFWAHSFRQTSLTAAPPAIFSVRHKGSFRQDEGSNKEQIRQGVVG